MKVISIKNANSNFSTLLFYKLSTWYRAKWIEFFNLLVDYTDIDYAEKLIVISRLMDDFSKAA